MTPARIHRFGPYFAAVAVAGITAFVMFSWDIKTLPQSIPVGTMTFGIVAAGFAGAQRSMLLTMTGAKVLRFAVRTGYHRDILAYLMDGIIAGVTVASISVIGFFSSTHTVFWNMWVSAITGAIALVICVTTRNELLIGRVVARYLEEHESAP